jgi:hypothetical protein
MAGFLRVLGVTILVLGLGTAGVAGWKVATDTHFSDVAAAYERHPDHALFQTEYWMAAAVHYGLVSAALGGLLGGLALGGILLALSELLRRTID